MNVQQEADRIMKLNLKSKAEGKFVLEKIKKRNGDNFAKELKQELQNRYKGLKNANR